MRRIKLEVWYDGTCYSGFQIQPKDVTIAGVLNEALSKIADHPVRVMGSSRTDSGVHSKGQVVAFDLNGTIPVENIPKAANTLLPADIVVYRAEEVNADFQPAFDVFGKHYRYTVAIGNFVSPFDFRYCYHLAFPLDMAKIQTAAKDCCGTHDFHAFTAAGSGKENFVRTVDEIFISVDGDKLYLDFWGRGFLYKMVRSITGCLLDVARGILPPSAPKDALKSGDRTSLQLTAPAKGLCLEKVYYSEAEYFGAMEANRKEIQQC